MFEDFIVSYGYYAVFLFACIEGEVAVLTAGFLCRKGMMSLELVMLFAFLGTLITEQCLFFVGRIYGTQLLLKHPKLLAKSKKIIAFLRKYDSIFIFGSRFIYGVRNISPIVIGMADISPIKFSSLNVPAAFVWSIAVAGVGYMFAEALESAKGGMEMVHIIALAALCAGLAVFIYKKKSEKKKSPKKRK